METSDRLDLLVIHPGAAHGIYGELGDSLVAVEPPLWARIIAAYARVRGFSVDILDAEAYGAGPEAVAEIVFDEKNPRLVCLAVYGHQPSASTQQMHAAGLTARAIKNRCDVPIIMVGGHVAALTERTLREEATDFACNGEGPATVVGLLKTMRGVFPEVQVGMDLIPRTPGNADVPGLAWLDGETYRFNPPAPLLQAEDLNGDAWDLLPMHRYRAHNWQCFGDVGRRQPYASIATSFGCPFACDFCCINAPFGSNGYRTRSPIKVANEIFRLYRDHGVRTFKITDEMFVLKERHYVAVCEAIINTGIADDLNIWAYSRVDTVQEGHLALLRRAGIRWLALGIESADPKVRDGARKAMKERDIEAVVRSIQAAGINVIGNYIFGLRDDDLASMSATLNLANRLQTEFANFYSAMAYPGSPLYAQAIKEGWTLPKSWRGYSQHNDDCRPIDTKHATAKEVLSFRDMAFNLYFRRSEYLRFVESKFGIETRKHVEGMTRYKLSRKLLRPESVAAGSG